MTAGSLLLSFSFRCACFSLRIAGGLEKKKKKKKKKAAAVQCKLAISVRKKPEHFVLLLSGPGRGDDERGVSEGCLSFVLALNMNE